MVRVAIAFLSLAWFGWTLAFPVVPLVSEPESPAYLAYVPSLITAAQECVLISLSDCRLYQDDSTRPLLSALAATAQRGVKVRVLLERRGDERPLPEQEAAADYLRGAGAEVRWDDPEVTLHTKFLVVDGRWCVIGSTHWTYSALERSVQMDLAVDAPELAAALAEFFDLLWAGDFSPRPTLPGPPWPEPAALPLLDLPGAGLHAEVIPKLLSRARERVCLLLYRLGYYPQYPDSPSNALVEALIGAARRGAAVQVLLEGGEEFAELAQANRLAAAYLSLNGIEVRFDPTGVTTHAKCLVVDGQDVLVSSANWAYYSLARNVEAGVAFLVAPALAQSLERAFAQLWAAGRLP